MGRSTQSIKTSPLIVWIFLFTQKKYFVNFVTFRWEVCLKKEKLEMKPGGKVLKFILLVYHLIIQINYY